MWRVSYMTPLETDVYILSELTPVLHLSFQVVYRLIRPTFSFRRISFSAVSPTLLLHFSHLSSQTP